MSFFANIKSEEQLKSTYRKLAFKFHPDHGGDCNIMTMINEEYQRLSESFKPKTKSLHEVQIGDTVYVNGTECEVTIVKPTMFMARAKGRSRTSYFDKETGLGVYNKKFQASYKQYNFSFN